MKSKFLTIMLVVCITTPGFFVIATEVSSSPIFANATDFFDLHDESYLVMNGDSQSEVKSDLPSIIPYWHDMVDKENVPLTGEGVYVAVLDTGLLPDWEYLFSEANIANELGIGFSHDIYWDDAVGDIVISDVISDRGFLTNYASGHGTHVTSTITGYNYANIAWIEGIAPDVTIIPVLVLDAWIVDTPYGLIGLSGGTSAMISTGIYYIADLAESLDGPVIINMSLGGSGETPEIEVAIDYAISKGVIIVASAGNNGEAGMSYPGAYTQVISAAACGWTDALAQGWTADVPEDLNTVDSLGNDYQVYLNDFSSRPNKTLGQKYHDLDVMAPGSWIVGPYKSRWAPVSNWGYYYVSGTSMAAPHVSAMAALILEIFPMFEQHDVEFVLKLAASGVGPNRRRGFPPIGEDVKVAYFDNYYYTVNWGRHDYGRGFLQADAAIGMAFLYYFIFYW